MLQTTPLSSVNNYYQSPLTVTVIDGGDPTAMSVPAGTTNPGAGTQDPITYSPGTVKIGSNVPWYYYNNNNFQIRNIHITGGQPGIYIWQHGDHVYYKSTAPSNYTDGLVLWSNIGSSFVLNIGSSANADLTPTAVAG